MTAPRSTLAMLPVGQPVDLFTAIGGLLDVAIGGALLGPGDGHDTAARIVKPDSLSWADTAARLRDATEQLQALRTIDAPDTPADVHADAEPVVEGDDGMTVEAIREHPDGGLTVAIGPEQVAADLALAIVNAFLPVMDAHDAPNYLEYNATTPAGMSLALCLTRHDGQSPGAMHRAEKARADALSLVVRAQARSILDLRRAAVTA